MKDRTVFWLIGVLMFGLMFGLVLLVAWHDAPSTQICKNPQVIIRDVGTTSTVYPLDC